MIRGWISSRHHSGRLIQFWRQDWIRVHFFQAFLWFFDHCQLLSSEERKRFFLFSSSSNFDKHEPIYRFEFSHLQSVVNAFLKSRQNIHLKIFIIFLMIFQHFLTVLWVQEIFLIAFRGEQMSRKPAPVHHIGRGCCECLKNFLKYQNLILIVV